MLHVVLDSVDHLALQSSGSQSVSQPASHRGRYRAGAVSHLALHQHGHVHKHVVQLADAVLKLDDLGVSRLDLVQRLLGHLGVHLDLGVEQVGGRGAARVTNKEATPT